MTTVSPHIHIIQISPLTLQYPMTCSAMLLMWSMYWCSLRWYFRAASWASFCRVDTFANRNCSLLFHLSLAIRSSCSKVALLSSSASVTVRSASTQQCSPLLTSSPESTSPHPLWQTLSPRWPASGFVCDSIPPGFETWQTRSLSSQEVGQSAHIVCAGNFPTHDNESGQSCLTSLNARVWATCADHAVLGRCATYFPHMRWDVALWTGNVSEQKTSPDSLLLSLVSVITPPHTKNPTH